MVTCPICSRTNTRALYGKDGAQIENCDDCQHQWLMLGERENSGAEAGVEGDPTDEHIQSMISGPDILTRKMKRLILEPMSRNPKPRALDLCCGSGRFLKEMVEAGAEGTGVDRGRWAERGKEIFDVNIILAEITEALEVFSREEKMFDVITLICALEHMRDPRNVLLSTRRILSPGGVVWVYIPSSDSFCARVRGELWGQYIVPEHTHLFSRKSMALVCRQAGFNVRPVTTRSHSDIVDVPLKSRKWGPRRGWNFVIKRILQVLGRGDLVLYELRTTGSPSAWKGVQEQVH